MLNSSPASIGVRSSEIRSNGAILEKTISGFLKSLAAWLSDKGDTQMTSDFKPSDVEAGRSLQRIDQALVPWDIFSIRAHTFQRYSSRNPDDLEFLHKHFRKSADDGPRSLRS